jgi:hypothetical protein
MTTIAAIHLLVVSDETRADERAPLGSRCGTAHAILASTLCTKNHLPHLFRQPEHITSALHQFPIVSRNPLYRALQGIS